MGMAENSKSVGTERKTNKEILQKVRPNISLEAITKMLKIRYFEHVMRAHQSLEKDIMLGITGGARKKGKPRMRWMDDIKSVTGLSVNDLKQEKVEHISEQHSREEKTNQCLIQGEGNGKPLL